MKELNNLSIYSGIVAIVVVILAIILKIGIDIYKHQVKKNLTIYLIVFPVLFVPAISLILMGTNGQKDNAKQQKQNREYIEKTYAPKSVTLTEESVSKTFTNDTNFNSDKENNNLGTSLLPTTSKQTNVNRQVNLYLKSIKNLDDYKISVKTYQSHDSFFGSYTPYHQTLQLTRKQK